MSDTPKDGGSAFPAKTPDSHPGFRHGGMSLRDWFAGQALLMVGTLVGAESITHVAAKRSLTIGETVAGMAYDVADAMLAERAKARTDAPE